MWPKYREQSGLLEQEEVIRSTEQMVRALTAR